MKPRSALPSVLFGLAVATMACSSENHSDLQAFPTAMKAKVLVVRDGQELINQNATYADSNGNGVMDPADAGWFAPASTVKVAIALAAIEKMGGRNGLDSHFQKMLILSDNDATNVLIDRAGGTAAITNMLKAKGFQNFIIGRKMASPNGSDQRCREGNINGNCASAADLIRSLRAVVEGGIFNVSDADRKFVQDTMSKTPSAIGSSHSDDYCRFFPSMAGPQKCGVSIEAAGAPYHFSNLAYIPQARAYVFVTVNSSSNAESAITSASKLMEREVRGLLRSLPTAGEPQPTQPQPMEPQPTDPQPTDPQPPQPVEPQPRQPATTSGPISCTAPKVAPGGALVYSAPQLSSSPIGALPAGTVLTNLGSRGEFTLTEVTLPSGINRVWVLSRSLQCDGESPILPRPNPVPQPDLTTYYSWDEILRMRTFRVTSDKLNCRAEGNPQAAVVRTLTRGATVQVIAERTPIVEQGKLWFFTTEQCWVAANRSLLGQ